MFRLLGAASVVALACFVLLVSIFKSAIPVYNFTQPANINGSAELIEIVEYPLPYPGSILPGNPLWWLKVTRDWAWIVVNRNSMKRAELYLLFADKRILMAKSLIESGNANLGVPTAIKAEQYLQSAYEEQEKAASRGVDTGNFLERLAKASIKHVEVLGHLVSNSPEDARPGLNQLIDLPKSVYEKSVHGLNEKQRPYPLISPLPASQN